MPKDTSKKNVPNLNAEFYKKLLEVSNNVGTKAEDILAVMTLESGLDSSAHNKLGNASGLIQLMPKTLKGLGFKGDHSDFRSMDAVNQLDWVEKYIKSVGGNFKSATHYYIANFLPAALKSRGIMNQDPNAIIAAKEPTEAHVPGVSTALEAKIYASNYGLDADKDGFITYKDIQAKMNRVKSSSLYQNAVKQLNQYRSGGAQDSVEYQENTINPPSTTPSAPPSTTAPIKTPEGILPLIDSFLKEIRGSEKHYIGLYKKYLPNYNFIIQIASSDYINSVEYARILCAALEEELLAKAYTHTNGKFVEVECSINGNEEDCYLAINQLNNSLSQEFKNATKKIGSININTNLIINKKSSLQKISGSFAEKNYRMFLLKFALGKQ